MGVRSIIIAPAGSGGGSGPALADAAPPAIASAGAVGVSSDAAREDHTHAGVTSVNGSQGAVTVLSQVGGATQSGGAISFTTGGTSGIIATTSGNDVAFRIGVTSQAAGDLLVATSATAWARRALGSPDALLGVNGAGTGLAYSGEPWLTGLHVGVGGSVANDTFGTATIQAGADATGGEALGVRANATAGKGRLAFYSSAEAAAGFLGYDETNDRLELGTSGKAWRISSNAAGTTLPIVGEADNENVGLAGATAFASMVDGVAIGAGTTAPTTNTGTFAALFNSAGTFRLYAAQTFSFFPGGTTERFRVTTSEAGFATTNVALYQIGGSYGGGVNVLWARNATTNPTTNPTNGVIFYVSGGEPLFRTSGGAIRCAVTLGAAVASGLFVAASSGGSPTRELKKRLMTFSDGQSFEAIDFAA